MIKYRKSKIKDIKELIELDKVANKEISWWDILSYNQFLKLHKEKAIFVVEDNNKIIGYLSSKIKKENKEEIVYLENMFVLKEYRKKNVARGLINLFIKDNQNKKLKLHAPRRLERFYKKFGFKTNYITMSK